MSEKKERYDEIEERSLKRTEWGCAFGNSLIDRLAENPEEAAQYQDEIQYTLTRKVTGPLLYCVRAGKVWSDDLFSIYQEMILTSILTNKFALAAARAKWSRKRRKLLEAKINDAKKTGGMSIVQESPDGGLSMPTGEEGGLSEVPPESEEKKQP